MDDDFDDSVGAGGIAAGAGLSNPDDDLSLPKATMVRIAEDVARFDP